MEKDVEEGEEDEEEVTKYVHTFLDEEDEIHKSKKANVSRANHQASSVKTSSAKASSIKVFMYIHSHCMAQHPSGRNGFNRDHITCWQDIICFLGEGPGVWK